MLTDLQTVVGIAGDWGDYLFTVLPQGIFLDLIFTFSDAYNI